ncbi:MAG: type II secretion system F family protein [Ignavibacteriaceae bacterium]
MITRAISTKELIDFNKTVSLMLLSKLSLIQSLDLYISQTKNDKLKNIVKRVVKDINSGQSLSKSFAKYPDIFSEVYVANMRVAEESGQVAEVLSEYTLYLEKMNELKRKIIQASRYPVFVLVITLAVVIFMVFFLIPTFEELFFSAKITLPALTRTIVVITYFIKDNAAILSSLILVSLLTLYSFRKNENVKIFTDNFLVKMPLVSDLYKKNLLARFSLSMSMLLKSKITLLEALKISRNISKNRIFIKEMEDVTKKVIKGSPFSSNISRRSVFFDLTFTRLLTVGEESAELEKVFSVICNYYSKEFDYKLDNIVSLVEPALILFIGLIVAVILIAMYIPMFELINNFGI